MKPLLVPRRDGFTLIEVTLAVGISAVALVGLLAMIPQGVMTMKRATDTAIETRIHQQLVSEISQTDWQYRGTYDYRSSKGEIRLYDAEGIPVDSDKPDDAIYAVRVLLPGADNGGSKITEDLPARLAGKGGRKAMVLDNSDVQEPDPLQLVIMEITSSPSVREKNHFDEEVNWSGIRTYRSTMVRMVDQVTAKGSGSNP